MTQKMSILMLVAVCAALAMSSMSVRAETSDHQHGSSNSSPAAGEDAQHAEHKSLYHMKRHIYSHTLASELRRFFDRPVHFVLSSLEETTAPTPITTSTSSTISTNATATTNATNATATTNATNTTAIADAITTPTTAASRNSSSLLNETLIPLINDANSMLFEWINATRSSIPYPNVGVNSTSAVAKRMSLAEMFQYNTSWIIGLAVIATVIGVFFLGCVIVICYTRRPYRRSGKVYEIESTAKKSQKIPQVPTIHPATKTATLTRSKELYY